jgi:hypothetical protein
MSRVGAARSAAASAPGAPGRAATPVSNARAAASRKNGAKSRGPKTEEGKARSSLNALKHGMRAAMHVVLPDEDAVAFNELQQGLFDELGPEGVLQLVLARRIAVAAWRLARADRMETEVFAERRWDRGDPLGLAMIRDGNGTRSFETLMRYRSAAMAEFMRALRALKALQAEQADLHRQAAGAEMPSRQPRVPAQVASRVAPNQPKSGTLPRLDYVLPDLPVTGVTLHEDAAPWLPDQPETGLRRAAGDGSGCRTDPKPASIGAS